MYVVSHARMLVALHHKTPCTHGMVMLQHPWLIFTVWPFILVAPADNINTVAITWLRCRSQSVLHQGDP